MKKILIIGLLIVSIILISGCVKETYTDEEEQTEEEGPFARMNTCDGLCKEKGYSGSRCVSEAYEGEEIKCGRSELVGGVAANCDKDENNTEITYLCCCSEVKPEKMNVINIYTSKDSEEIAIANIFVNNKKGIITSFMVGEPFISEITEALDAAKSQNLTLESERIEIIDGEEALVLYGEVIEPTDDLYLLPLRYFLSFDYEWKVDIFDFDLIEVNKWTASKDGKKVLEFQNMPGILTSKALPPPGYTPEEHPFLTGSALVTGGEESNIRNILDKSSSFVDFLTKLVEDGYLVVAEDGRSLLR